MRNDEAVRMAVTAEQASQAHTCSGKPLPEAQGNRGSKRPSWFSNASPYQAAVTGSDAVETIGSSVVQSTASPAGWKPKFVVATYQESRFAATSSMASQCSSIAMYIDSCGQTGMLACASCEWPGSKGVEW